MKNVQNHAWRFFYPQSNHDLVHKIETTGINIMTLRPLATEFYICANDLNPEYPNEIFTMKNFPYHLILW